jgi:hypothetical protein
MAWSPTLALRSWLKPSRWSGSRDWSPACMAAMASSHHSASLPGETPSSRLRASRVSPRRMRRTTSVLRSAGPSCPVLAAGRSCGRAAPSLRIDQPDAVLLRPGRHCPHVSQMGVLGNRAPTQPYRARMRVRDLYAQILGITAPWHVSDVRLDVPAGTVEVVVEHRGQACCPQRGKACPGYDTRQRRWRHLDTCQLRTMLVADVPRVECP